MNTTTTRQGRGDARRQKARRMMRGRRRRPAAPRGARTQRGSASVTPPVWRESLLVLLDYAELDVLEHPDERARVQAVRDALCARVDGLSPPPLDLRDLAFTMGLIATALGSHLLDHGLLLLCLRMLSPSVLAEFERAKGFVRSAQFTAEGDDV